MQVVCVGEWSFSEESLGELEVHDGFQVNGSEDLIVDDSNSVFVQIALQTLESFLEVALFSVGFLKDYQSFLEVSSVLVEARHDVVLQGLLRADESSQLEESVGL